MSRNGGPVPAHIRVAYWETGKPNNQQETVMGINRLYRYELGAGAGVVIGSDSGKLVLGDSFPATTSTNLLGLASDRSGNIFMTDPAQSVIYKITESGYIQLFAGTYGTQGLVNGPALSAKFSDPRGICVDKSGNIYVADAGNTRVRKIDIGGKVSTMAGGFTLPVDVAVAPNGDIIVCDQGANKIYRVENGGRTFLIAGDAGGGSGDVAGIDGITGLKIKGTAAKFNAPQSVTVNQFGEVFVADTGNFKVKKIGLDGWVVRFCGSTDGNVNGVANTAKFHNLQYIECHPLGMEMYAIDNVASETRVKKIDYNGTVSTAAYNAGTHNVRGITVSPANALFVVRSDTFSWNENSSSSNSSSSKSSPSSQSSSSSSGSSSSSSSSKSSPSSQSSSSSSSSSST